MNESREEQIARWEKDGLLVPDCAGCKEFYEAKGKPSDVFAPRHQPSSGCKSGKHPHCTCDTCF